MLYVDAPHSDACVLSLTQSDTNKEVRATDLDSRNHFLFSERREEALNMENKGFDKLFMLYVDAPLCDVCVLSLTQGDTKEVRSPI